MTGWGQSLLKWVVRATSALPLKATDLRTLRHVSKVPKAESVSQFRHVRFVPSGHLTSKLPRAHALDLRFCFGVWAALT
jgi:hypothetical protein